MRGHSNPANRNTQEKNFTNSSFQTVLWIVPQNPRTFAANSTLDNISARSLSVDLSVPTIRAMSTIEPIFHA